MAHGHHHHNNSLRRAIRAQAGPEAYPYMKYSPTLFSPPKIGYAGYGAPYGGLGDFLKKAGKGLSSLIKEVAPHAVDAGGGYFESKMESESAERMNQASLDAQTEVARINAESNEKQKLMEYEFNVGGTKISAWTVVGIVGGVAVLGGLTFFVLRRRKK